MHICFNSPKCILSKVAALQQLRKAASTTGPPLTYAAGDHVTRA